MEAEYTTHTTKTVMANPSTNFHLDLFGLFKIQSTQRKQFAGNISNTRFSMLALI